MLLNAGGKGGYFLVVPGSGWGQVGVGSIQTLATLISALPQQAALQQREAAAAAGHAAVRYGGRGLASR